MTDSVFAKAVEPLSLRQRRLIVVLAIIVAATRFLAVSHSMWDWDEALFASALQHYDVAQHHPHPPGFPLFFALAKLVNLFVHDEFHSLRAVSVFASLFVFPAFFALARSLRFRFRTCAVGATLFCFLPNVWYWGGTGFTDELALVTALAGAALLLRDDQRARTYIGGCLFFAATMLVRAQNVLLLWPWIEASWRRLRAKRTSDVFAGTALIVILVLTGYGITAKLTGFAAFAKVTAEHQHYIATVDGALNPGRIPMANLLQDFLFDPFESRAASTVLFVFALLSFVRPRRVHAVILLTFLPNFFLAWFLLSTYANRPLAIGYLAFDVLLAADGMDVAASFLASRARDVSRDQIAAVLQVLFAAIVVGRYVFWVWPGLEEVRLRDSPPVQAMNWIRQNVPRGATIQVSSGLDPFAAYFLTGYKIVSDLDRSTAAANVACIVTDRIDPSSQAINFRRPRQHLWALFNRRYFEASVLPRESRVGSRVSE